MYAVNYITVYKGQPSEDAVRERRNGQYATAKAAWAEVFGYATSHLRMATVAIENIDVGLVAGTPDKLRRERCGLVQRLRRLEQWIVYAKARC